MKLQQLSNTTSRPARKRVGRGDGSGWGTTCGRGYKGSGQRAGYASRPHFEGGQIPLFRRLPKRGFKNPKHANFTLINLHTLEKFFEAGAVVDLAQLSTRGLVNAKTLDAGLKVLGDGEITKAMTVAAVKFSATAKAKIEAAGGTCQVVS
jgi:large subunit ribosomal protein L15